MKSVSFLTRLRLKDRTAGRRDASADVGRDESALLDRARGCDAQAVGELYDRYAHRIYAYVLSHVGNQQLAEDLTADVFIKMLHALRNANAWEDSFSGWLYRIAHNLMIDHFRKCAHSVTLPLDEQIISAQDNPVAMVERIMRAQNIGAALLRLTEEQQLVIAYKFFQGLTNLQVAELMGKSEGAIKSLQYRALAALRRALEASPNEPDE